MSNNFSKLGLADFLMNALNELGYEVPTQIQEQTIPAIINGDDVLALAQTGTGKTAGFALPILQNIDVKLKAPQAIIIAPTRELAIQVAEAFHRYAKDLPDFNVTPIYGGQDYSIQLRALKRGAHVVVGTPGRIQDHLRRGTLKTNHLKTLVLDEADEMLNMGFIDDIEWILEQIPHPHQTALFSATMHNSIKKIAERFLHHPKKIQIEAKTVTVDAIAQSYIRVEYRRKLEVLTRYLEVEEMQAAIIFVRTKNESSELTEKLQARGLAAAALNGDIDQSMRKKVVDQLKSGHLDIVVATDVAARGIDVERITHVINFDIPTNTESYIHRIGRTGRAGREGKALSFITSREQRLLRDIERAINKRIEEVQPPSLEEIHKSRKNQLKTKIINAIEQENYLKPYYEIIDSLVTKDNCEIRDVAAALAYLSEQDNPLADYETLLAQAKAEKRQRREQGRDFQRKPEARHDGRKRNRSRNKHEDKSFTDKKRKKSKGSRDGFAPKPRKQNNNKDKPTFNSEGKRKKLSRKPRD